MLTWILIAIIVAALFGVIDFKQIREWLIKMWRKYFPEAKKLINQAKEKIEEQKNKKEDT